MSADPRSHTTPSPYEVHLQPPCVAPLIPHLSTAQLVQDPPPYRQSAMLRGPRHLPVHL